MSRALHYPRVHRIRAVTPAGERGLLWQSGCACGWVGALWATREQALPSSLEHQAALQRVRCSACGDVDYGRPWEGRIICDACFYRLIRLDLSSLCDELAV